MHKIELLDCSGNSHKEWISTGVVKFNSKSNSFYFVDNTTKSLVEVSGMF